ncbi:MAG: hypothetical protein K2Y16_12140 [Burkholderiales bacterium]|nr:hypothetical protein [Burkholderiales bacterium]
MGSAFARRPPPARQREVAGPAARRCRLSILFALRYPDAVRGLLLWRITGGRFAAQRLAENY